MSFKAAIFDLDGTIMDSGEGIVRSVSYALDKMGVTDYSESENYRFIGPPLVDSFMEYYGMTEDEAKQAVVYYRERYSVTGIYESHMYEGVRELIFELKRQGIKLYIGSSKPLKFVEQILRGQGIYECFDFVAGATFDGKIDTKEQVMRTLWQIRISISALP